MEKKQLILLAGQSNMAGRDVASPEDLEPIENVEVFRHGKWYPAIEPVTRDRSMVGCFSAADERMSSPDPWDNPIPGEGMTVRGVGPGRRLQNSSISASRTVRSVSFRLQSAELQSPHGSPVASTRGMLEIIRMMMPFAPPAKH